MEDHRIGDKDERYQASGIKQYLIRLVKREQLEGRCRTRNSKEERGNVLIMPPVLRRFRRAGTPFFDFRKAASVLITDGPYGFSRNPSYVSLTLVFLAGLSYL